MSGVEFQSLRDVWQHNLEKFPGKTAVICEGEPHSYRECDLLSDRLRSHLAGRFGVRKGDKVAIAAPNGLEYFIAYWAVMKNGSVAIPVNTRLGVDELAQLLAQSDAKTLFVHKANWGVMQRALADCPQVKHIVAIGFEEDGVTPFGALTADAAPCDAPPDISEDDPAIIMFTSGTTGRPKGAIMRQGDLLFNNKIAVYAHSLRHEDVILVVVPMFHPTASYSLVPTCALLGATLVMAPRADITYLLELVQRHRITVFVGVPALFRFLAVQPGVEEYDLRSLRLIAYSGSPMPPATIARLREIFPRVALHNFFGLTETISMTHVLPDSDATTRPESIGKLLPHVRQRIVREDGQDAAPGEVGELHFHRSNVICDYWKEPGLLEKSMNGEWFNTHDLADVDEQGYVYLKGRTKDMIIVAGENVYAVEVENCIMTQGKVMEAAVIGVPATGSRLHLGELVKAFVVPQPGTALTEADIKRHCMEHLASYKVPQIIEFRTELPRNAAGKVLKRALKEE